MRRPRATSVPDREEVVVSFDTADLAALDAWIAAQDIDFTRDEAIRAIVSATLTLMDSEDD